MKLQFDKITPFTNNNYTSKNKSVTFSNVKISSNTVLEKHQAKLAQLNKQSLTFKGYYGDIQPAKKLFYIVSGRNTIYEDNWTKSHLIQAGIKKWINAHPAELLKRTAEQAIQSICTLVKSENQSPQIPSYIPTPNYGDKWGRKANYIEINPRAIAK